MPHSKVNVGKIPKNTDYCYNTVPHTERMFYAQYCPYLTRDNHEWVCVKYNEYMDTEECLRNERCIYENG